MTPLRSHWLLVILAFSILANLSIQPTRLSAMPQYLQPVLFAQTGDGSTATAIAIDNAGTVYWSTTIFWPQKSQLLKLARGDAAPTVVLSGLNDVLGIGIDATGDLYYAEYSLGILYELPVGSSTPRVLLTSLNHPNFMSVDAAGDVYFITGGLDNQTVIPCGDKIMEYRVTTRTLTTILTATAYRTNHGYGGLAIHPSGDLYFTNCEGMIGRLLQGSPNPQILLLADRYLLGIAVDGDRNIFYAQDIPSVNMLPAGSRTPITLSIMGDRNQVSLDQQDNVYYTGGSAIWKIPSNGIAPSTTVATSGLAHILVGEPLITNQSAQVMAVDNASNLYLVKYGSTLSGSLFGRLFEFRKNQQDQLYPYSLLPTSILDIGLPGGPFWGIVGIAVDTSGNIYITADNYARPNSGQLARLSPDGKVLSTLINVLNHPGAVSVDSSGNVYVLNDNPAGEGYGLNFGTETGISCWRSVIRYNTYLNSTQTVLAGDFGYRAINVDSGGNLYFASCVQPRPKETDSIGMLPANSSAPVTIASDFAPNAPIVALFADQAGNILFTYYGVELLLKNSREPLTLNMIPAISEYSWAKGIPIAFEKQGDTFYWNDRESATIWRVSGLLNYEAALKHQTSTLLSATASRTSTALSTTTGGGIPGFPFESILGGLLAGAVLIIIRHRREHLLRTYKGS